MRDERAPARGRAWGIVAALSVTETVSYGVLVYAVTVFVEPMRRGLGLSLAAITGAVSLGLLVSGLATPSAGRWIDARGARGLMTLGSAAAALLVLAWSAVHSAVQLYAVWAGLGLAMAAVLYDPAFAVLASWFSRRQGAALTVLTFVAGFASVIFVPLAGILVDRVGWRDALRLLALVLAVVTVPLHALVVRRPPAGAPAEAAAEATVAAPSVVPPATAERRGIPSASAEAAFADPTFVLVAAAFGLSTFVASGLAVHLVPLLVWRGLAPVAAAGVVGAIGLAALPGRLALTPLSGPRVRSAVVALTLLAQAVALAGLLVGAPAWLFVVLYGAGFGALTPARAALLVELYGPRHFGRINGRAAMVSTLARGAAPVAAGGLAATAGYDALLVALLALCLAAAAAVIAARGRREEDAPVGPGEA